MKTVNVDQIGNNETLVYGTLETNEILESDRNAYGSNAPNNVQIKKALKIHVSEGKLLSEGGLQMPHFPHNNEG